MISELCSLTAHQSLDREFVGFVADNTKGAKMPNHGNRDRLETVSAVQVM
jgi:hypothetical protein